MLLNIVMHCGGTVRWYNEFDTLRKNLFAGRTALLISRACGFHAPSTIIYKWEPAAEKHQPLQSGGGCSVCVVFVLTVHLTSTLFSLCCNTRSSISRLYAARHGSVIERIAISGAQHRIVCCGEKWRFEHNRKLGAAGLDRRGCAR